MGLLKQTFMFDILYDKRQNLMTSLVSLSKRNNCFKLAKKACEKCCILKWPISFKGQNEPHHSRNLLNQTQKFPCNDVSNRLILC